MRRDVSLKAPALLGNDLWPPRIVLKILGAVRSFFLAL